MIFGSKFIVLLYCALIFVMGALAASAFILEKRPDAKGTLNKLTPYKGAIGIAILIWSIIHLLRFLFSGYVGYMFDMIPLTTITYLIMTITGIGGGFLLGYQIIEENVLSGSKDAAERGDSIQKKLAVYEKPLGLAAMADSVLLAILILFEITI